MGKSFTSSSEARAPITFDIDGEDFSFVPPKQSTLAMQIIRINPRSVDADSAQARALFTWLGLGLDPDHEPRGKSEGHTEYVQGCQGCRIEERLTDPADSLELPLLTEIIEFLMEAAYRVVPTSPSRSSGSPRRGGRSSTGG